MTDAHADRTKLRALLEQIGFTVEEEGPKGVHILTSGVHVTVLVYDDGSLSLLCSVASDRDIPLPEVNDANSRIRFAKFSVDEKVLLLEADFVFDLYAADAREQLQRFMDFWHSALLAMRNLVREIVD